MAGPPRVPIGAPPPTGGAPPYGRRFPPARPRTRPNKIHTPRRMRAPQTTHIQLNEEAGSAGLARDVASLPPAPPMDATGAVPWGGLPPSSWAFSPSGVTRETTWPPRGDLGLPGAADAF